jgi:hypothetical protein
MAAMAEKSKNAGVVADAVRSRMTAPSIDHTVLALDWFETEN